MFGLEKITNTDTDTDIDKSSFITPEFNTTFKLPIYYNDNKVSVKQHIIDDLELVRTLDPSSCNPIYSFAFENNNEFSGKLIHQIAEYYTTDVQFLKDNQCLLKNFKDEKVIETNLEAKYESMIEIWNDVKNDAGFKDRYYYIDWPMWEFLNKSDTFLQIMSLYNMASPVISLFIPIIILIIPFFVIKLKGLELNMEEYYEILKVVMSQHAIGKLFTQFNDVSLNQKMYLLASAAFYVFSIYQNVLTCIRFNNNMKKIHKYLKEVKIYIDNTIYSMDNYLKYSSELGTHKKFNDTLREKKEILNTFLTKISNISEYNFNIQKVTEIGYVLKYFYELHDNKSYEDVLLYSFGFNGYIDSIKGIQKGIEERKINFAKFTEKKKKNQFKNTYYAPLKDKEHVKNHANLEKNLIITGPNASGKTTILKSTLINIILTQQFGCGFYESATLCPYKYIHCYLNIPDTSGRDSLFQAEARRCKEIIDIIDANKKDNHFCAFDELYSGTNPDEAASSSVAFMEYLIKNKNISCLLTTHFIKVCKKLNKHKNIENCHMMTEKDKDKNKIKYIYKLANGISEIKGGINVLYDMNYPEEIIKKTL